MNTVTVNEGYVKYTSEHTPGPPVDVCNIPHWEELNNVRTRLYKLGLIGVTSDGIGFGNVSVRVCSEEFFISGTATGALPVLTPAEYCLVIACAFSHNRAVSTGPVQPSPESMTPGAVHHSNAGVHCVIHIHSKKFFDGMIRDNYPATPESAAYGTPEIALAIGECITRLAGVNTESVHTEGMIVLAGHDEGVIAYGPSPERACNLIMELNNKYGG
jgi:ribulose-5-phosphate 4-epimerase/fuculose-1-phosphate aldolase